jgi:predicted DNA-binding protein (UPF0251 family)/predicted Fe-Mo cluster-binding NifX family protein
LVENGPPVSYFKPKGLPLRELEEEILLIEGFEALRLVEIEGLDQENAAYRMNISRQTFGRVLSAARLSVAKVVVLGRALRITGDYYTVNTEASTGCEQPPAAELQYENSAGAGTNKEGVIMAKIAVSSEGLTLDDLVDPRFGRAGGFVLADSKTMEFSYLDNSPSQCRAQGAGIQAAEIVAKAGAEVVLTGYVGPKAFQALRAAGITIVQNLEGITVRQALEHYRRGQVQVAQSPNRKG